MYVPNTTAIDTVETLIPQIEALLTEWFEHINRKEPVPIGAAQHVNTLLNSARRVFARAPASHNVAPVDVSKPVMAGELFVAVLKTHAALHAFADRYSHRDANDDLVWHTRTGTRCPLCHQPHVYE